MFLTYPASPAHWRRWLVGSIAVKARDTGYVDGKRHGEWVNRYDSGIVWHRTYRNGEWVSYRNGESVR